jgi:hypothetical protein
MRQIWEQMVMRIKLANLQAPTSAELCGSFFQNFIAKNCVRCNSLSV